ncbi:type VII secretion-associated serine protease mycosin [Streptomyces sp. 8N616]|uniref:type VII secretion-associated serine protease mycosin n=1 Tax=Streptomyces sp. 8N616 TaxID=3457414 RepID=UPI003FD5833C
MRLSAIAAAACGAALLMPLVAPDALAAPGPARAPAPSPESLGVLPAEDPPPLEAPAGGSGGCVPPSDVVVHKVPWAQRQFAPERVWPLTRGEGVTVAVIDSGVDGDIPQLKGAVVPEGAGADSDCAGHGTFVAGIVAARQVDGVGFAGIAPAAKVLAIRHGTDGSGSASDLAEAIRLAVSEGADVINISSAAFYASEPLEEAVRFAERHDVVVVAATGNEGQQGNPRTYPAAYPDVVAVGAVDEKGELANFSGTGKFVDLAAPGVRVISVSTGSSGGGHLIDDGTSFAAPFVSGVAALIRSYHPELSAAQVRRRLALTADPPGRRVPDPGFGWGVANPYAAVATVLPDEGTARRAPATSESGVRLSAPHSATDGTAARTLALGFAGGATTLAAGAGLTVRLVRRGRRRGWRPAENDSTRGAT